jgi:hypothetical protein
MFLKHGAKKVNEIELVAPTGFEPVFGRGRVFVALFSRFRATWREKIRQDSNT